MRILLLDKSADQASPLLQALRDHSFELESLKTEQEFLSKACNPQYGAWLVDLGESPGQRFKIIEDLRSQKILTPAL